MGKCTILGCNFEFITKEQAELHAVNTWHCIGCGYCDGNELTIHNIATHCEKCLDHNKKRIRVNFKRKAYVVDGRLSIKEQGKWIHYE